MWFVFVTSNRGFGFIICNGPNGHDGARPSDAARQSRARAMPPRAPASSSGGSHDDGTIFARAEGVDRVTRAPTLANAGYPFVTHRSAAKHSSSRSKPSSSTATATAGKRKTGKDVARGAGAKGTSTTRAYVRVEDVIESTRAAEEALKRATTSTSSDTALASERERVKRYAQAQIEVAEQRRAVEEKERENKVLIEENERLARELGAALATTSKQRRDSDDEDDVDETVQELFEMVELERRERRALEEKLGAYERDVERTLGDARNESDEARRRVEDAEATVREQEMKLSQAADIIGELRTALLQVMETHPDDDDDDASLRSRARSEAPSEATEAPGGTPLERTTAAVRVWEGKVEKLVMETVHSALTRAMDSPALQSSKQEGEQVILSVTDAINHELSAIVENAMSGIVDEMRFQFGQNENEDEDDARIGGRKRFIVWLADENMRRAHLEEQLHTVQDELARSEASRQIATQRWLQAMNQVDGSVYDDESDLGDVLSRLDEYSDDGTSVYSIDGGGEVRGIRNRRASSVAGDMPARSRFRTRHDGARSETHDYANLRDVSPINASMPAFLEDDERNDEDDEAHADIAIVATPGGHIFLAIRSMLRTYVFPLVYTVSKCVYAICSFCASSPTFELVWPVTLMLLAFYWKLGAFTTTSGAVASVAPAFVAKPAAATTPAPSPVQDVPMPTSASIPRAIPMPPVDRLRIIDA